MLKITTFQTSGVTHLGTLEKDLVMEDLPADFPWDTARSLFLPAIGATGEMVQVATMITTASDKVLVNFQQK